MAKDLPFALTVVIATLVLLLMAGVVVVLLGQRAQRRQRHRAEIAELNLRRDRALLQAEREATGHTLTEVGRELHDNVGQLLTVAQVGLLDHLDPAAMANPRVRTALDALDQGLEEVRRLGRSLNQDNWQRRELIDALELEAVRLERLGKARVLVVMGTRPADPPADVKAILFRAFQEVIANALRHSRARTITITVGDAQGLTLCVADDGRGFDAATTGAGSGLQNIRRRCALVRYTAVLNTAPGQGCTWCFQPDHDHEA